MNRELNFKMLGVLVGIFAATAVRSVVNEWQRPAIRTLDCADPKSLTRDEIGVCEMETEARTAERKLAAYSSPAWHSEAGFVLSRWSVLPDAGSSVLPDAGVRWADTTALRGVRENGDLVLAASTDATELRGVRDAGPANLVGQAYSYATQSGTWVVGTMEYVTAAQIEPEPKPMRRWISAADAKGDCLDRYPAEPGFYGGWVQSDSLPGYFELENAGPYGWERVRVCDPATAHPHAALPPPAPPLSLHEVLAMFFAVLAMLLLLTTLFIIECVLAMLLLRTTLFIIEWVLQRPRRKSAPRPDPVQSVPTVEEQKAQAGEPIGGKPKQAS